MLEFVEDLWREFRSGARSETGKAHSRSAGVPFRGMIPLGDGRPEASHPAKLSATSAEDLCNAIWATAARQASFTDRKAALEALVRGHLKIQGFSVFSKSEETAFIGNIRGCGSDQALRELVESFAGKYRLLDSALLHSVRINANLV